MGTVKVTQENMMPWATMLQALYEMDSIEETLAECKKFITKKGQCGFLYEENGEALGAIHLSVRNDYVNGTKSSPVLFIEGIYVNPEHRWKGIGKILMDFSVTYAKENGFKQVASDCLLSNHTSEKFHKGCGFEETERVIYFVKNV